MNVLFPPPTREFVRNTGDPKQLRKAKRLVERESLDRRNDLAWILSDPRGRRWLTWLLIYAGVGDRVTTTNDVAEMCRRAGALDVGQEVFEQVRGISQTRIQELLAEHDARRVAVDAELGGAETDPKEGADS